MGLFTVKKILIITLSIILIGFVSVPLTTLYILNNGHPYHKYLVNKHVPIHLEQIGYTDNDIIMKIYIQPKHGINNSVYHGHYMVVFKDEPQLEYLYGVTKKGKNVVQFCEKETLIAVSSYGDRTTKKANHSESECIGYLENRG